MAVKKSSTPASPSSKSSATRQTTPVSTDDFAFGKENYVIMLIGLVVIVIGFLLMTGGGSEDPNVFDPSIFSARRITLAPLLVLIGFGIEIYAIIKKPNA